MKILLTSFTYPPNKDGVSEAARSMAERFANLGHEVAVATQNIPGSPEFEELNGVKVFRFGLESCTPLERQSHTEQRRYVEFISETQPQVLINHCWDAWPAILSFRHLPDLKAKKIQVSHGYTSHLVNWHRRPPFGLGLWTRQLARLIREMPAMIRWYDAVVLLSDMKGLGRFFDHTLACWLRHPNIHIIPNSVDIGSFPTDGQPFRKRHAISSGPLVLCVANYSERKNQAQAVRAFLRADIPDSTLVFIGSEFNSYSRRVRQLDTSLRRSQGACRVIFLENLTRAETLNAIAACDIFLLTAKAETQPIVLIEAMAAGKPWISTPVGCVPKMEGGIIASGDKMISRALIHLATDVSKRAELGNQGRAAALEKYSDSHQSARWNRLFASLAIPLAAIQSE